MEFNNNNSIKEFVRTLIITLDSINEIMLTKELKEWRDCAFTTSSEYLGELRTILKKVENITTLDVKVKNDINCCIATIDKAFEETKIS